MRILPEIKFESNLGRNLKNIDNWVNSSFRE